MEEIKFNSMLAKEVYETLDKNNEYNNVLFIAPGSFGLGYLKYNKENKTWTFVDYASKISSDPDLWVVEFNEHCNGFKFAFLGEEDNG